MKDEKWRYLMSVYGLGVFVPAEKTGEIEGNKRVWNFIRRTMIKFKRNHRFMIRFGLSRVKIFNSKKWILEIVQKNGETFRARFIDGKIDGFQGKLPIPPQREPGKPGIVRTAKSILVNKDFLGSDQSC